MRCILLALAMTIVALAAVSSVEAAPNGLQISEGALEIVTVWQTTVVGEVGVDEGAVSGTLTFEFVGPDSLPITPLGSDSVRVIISDPLTAEYTSLTPFTGMIASIGEHGEISMQVEYWEGGTVVYTSPAIPLHVHSPHAEPEGLVVKRNNLPIATIWEGVVHGSVRVSLGETDSLEVSYLDIDSVEFQPEDEEFWLVAASMDPLVADVDTIPGQRYWFSTSGLIADTADLQLDLYHVDHVDYSAQLIPIVVTCCVGTRGNVNMVGTIDLSDLSLLIAYLTTTPRPVLPCADAANVNGSLAVSPDLSDLSLLIGYLTVTPRPVLPSCL